MFKKLALIAAFPLALSLVACEQKTGETGQETTPATTEEAAPAEAGGETMAPAEGTGEAAPAETAPSEAAPADTGAAEEAPAEPAPAPESAPQ